MVSLPLFHRASAPKVSCQMVDPLVPGAQSCIAESTPAGDIFCLDFPLVYYRDCLETVEVAEVLD